MFSLKKVAEESIPTIQALAEKTWSIAYASILPPAQMSYMLEMFYSTNALIKQMQQGHQFILVADEEKAHGFASYSTKDLMIRKEVAIHKPANHYRLHKLYISPDQQGKGLGQLAINFIVADIKANGGTEIELNVNRSNKAIGFYSKYGFQILRHEDNDIGNGYFMNDYVMQLSLK